MKVWNDSDLDQARTQVLLNQAKALVWPVLLLSLVAWWKQGFITALVGGLALYAFLFLLVLVSGHFERRKHKMR